MLKAIKECLKNWLVTHERLYWYIVVGLAVLGFGIVTALGCAKLEKANAAEDYAVIIDSMYEKWEELNGDLSLETHPYYVIIYNGTVLYFIPSSWQGVIDFVSDNGPRFRNSDSTVFYGIRYELSTGQLGIFSGSRINMYSLTQSNTGVIYSNYLPEKCYDDEWKDGYLDTYYNVNCSPVPSTTYAYWGYVPVSYSVDAPYINFQKVVVDNKITDYYFNPHVFDSFYETYIKASSWKYFGKLNNMDAEKDKEYLLECEFLVQLPTADYVLGQYEAHDLDIGWESNVIKHGADLVHEWNVNKKAPFVEYSFLYTFPLVPDDNGNFTYQMTFDEMELLIKYFNEDFRNEWNEYSDYFRSVLLSYIHVECVTASVETTRDDCIVYGKICTNQFARGIYDTCIEVIPEIDINTATPEEIDKILSDAVENANNQYIKDLEDRLENLENQVSGNTSVQMGFGNLEGSDLWSGFVGLSQGIGGMAPAVQSLSALTGSVLAFLPLQMSGIMATTMLAICVIAIIKAIRG